jgi:hypothetical protein
LAGRLFGQSTTTTARSVAVASSACGSGSKLFHVRNEAMATAPARNKLQQQKQHVQKSSFADAVAFASGSSKGIKHRAKVTGSTVVHLSGNKRMRIPTDVAKGAGPRAIASKWKKC